MRFRQRVLKMIKALKAEDRRVGRRYSIVGLLGGGRTYGRNGAREKARRKRQLEEGIIGGRTVLLREIVVKKEGVD